MKISIRDEIPSYNLASELFRELIVNYKICPSWVEQLIEKWKGGESKLNIEGGEEIEKLIN